MDEIVNLINEMENLPKKISDESSEKISDDDFAKKIKDLKEKLQLIQTTLTTIRQKI